MPVEVPNPIRFEDDHEHASYDAEYANRFWRALVKIDEVLKEFRARLHREGQSRPLLLGELRHGSDSLLRQAGARTPRR